MGRVGILYVCTGKYSQFWESFFCKCEKNFLPESEIHYFVWTDDEKILSIKHDRIHLFFQTLEPWPNPTLKRFEYFSGAISEISQMDYLMFMNSNLLVEESILEGDILPSMSQGLFATLHPGYFDKCINDYAYDSNPNSLAYIGSGEGKYYFAGGFNGGITEEYIELIIVLKDRIQKDLDNGIIARWHDESHLNRFLLDYDKDIKILSPAYLHPEEVDIPFERKIVIIDKRNLGGHTLMRNVVT